VVFRNGTGVNQPIRALDTNAPTLAGRSWHGYAVGLNEADLPSIPARQFGTIESLGQSGNWIVRANGTPIRP
jgi:hypothetical protein